MSQDVTRRLNNEPAPAAMPPELDAIVACPACAAPLQGSHCQRCDIRYPMLGPVPWLLPDPQGTQSEWRNRWHRALRGLAAREQAAAASLKTCTSALTRARLERLRDGCAEHRAAVQKLLAPLEVGMAGTTETYIALGTPLPEHHGLFSYAPNLFRDWSWGSLENRGALNALLEAWEQGGASRPTRIAVLGSGGGRLAYDLHTNLQPELTVGLEINPYLVLAAAQLCSGSALQLTEFPIAPRTTDDVAVSRTLQCPDPQAAAGLVFIAGDALQPPIAAHAFDLVVTPWFSDVCGAQPQALAGIVNRLLKSDGVWLNHGSVTFTAPDPGACGSLAEFVEQVSAQGLERTVSTDTTLPYLQSPSSRHGRIEQVNTTLFQKRETCSAPIRHPLAAPAWLDDTTLAVPHTDAFKLQSNSTAVHAFLMSLIDGQRSIDAMAQVVAARGMLPEADARQALRGFMEKMQQEAQAAQGH